MAGGQMTASKDQMAKTSPRTTDALSTKRWNGLTQFMETDAAHHSISRKLAMTMTVRAEEPLRRSLPGSYLLADQAAR